MPFKFPQLICKFLRHSEEGASAVEFAIIAPIFLAMIGGIMGHSLVSFQISQVDYITYKAATKLRIANSTVDNAEDFKNDVVCPMLSGLLDCSKLEVGVQAHPWLSYIQTYSRRDISGQFCHGTTGDIVFISIKYELDPALKKLYFGTATVNADDVTHISSKYVVAREPVVTEDRNCPI